MADKSSRHGCMMKNKKRHPMNVDTCYPVTLAIKSSFVIMLSGGDFHFVPPIVSH
jgi:hypothetical protein